MRLLRGGDRGDRLQVPVQESIGRVAAFVGEGIAAIGADQLDDLGSVGRGYAIEYLAFECHVPCRIAGMRAWC
jgi:hypothetical protein